MIRGQQTQTSRRASRQKHGLSLSRSLPPSFPFPYRAWISGTSSLGIGLAHLRVTLGDVHGSIAELAWAMLCYYSMLSKFKFKFLLHPDSIPFLSETLFCSDTRFVIFVLTQTLFRSCSARTPGDRHA